MNKYSKFSRKPYIKIDPESTVYVPDTTEEFYKMAEGMKTLKGKKARKLYEDRKARNYELSGELMARQCERSWRLYNAEGKLEAKARPAMKTTARKSITAQIMDAQAEREEAEALREQKAMEADAVREQENFCWELHERSESIPTEIIDFERDELFKEHEVFMANLRKYVEGFKDEPGYDDVLKVLKI